MSRIVSIIPIGLWHLYTFDEAVEILKEEGRVNPDEDWLIWSPDYKSRKFRKKPQEKVNGQ